MPATFDDLINLMEKLRSPDGCPWDREQTYATLAPMLLEEAYEAFEAVEEAREGRPAELRDELGDLLFQIVFYAQVAKERGDFSIDDVTNAIHDKDGAPASACVWLTHRPTIQRRAAQLGSDEGRRNDAPRGRAEREESLLDGVSSKAPALMEAHQLSTKAARVGFDWKRIEDIFAKLEEEMDELRAAIQTHAQSNSEADHTRVREEIGDLLFAVTNIARHLNVEPEAALKLTNRKFRRRFGYIEKQLRERGQTFDATTLDEMEALWQEAKKRSEQ